MRAKIARGFHDISWPGQSWRGARVVVPSALVPELLWSWSCRGRRDVRLPVPSPHRRDLVVEDQTVG